MLDSMFEASEEQIESGGTNTLGTYIQQYISRLIAPVAFVAAIISMIIKRPKPDDGNLVPAENKEQKGYVINKDREE